MRLCKGAAIVGCMIIVMSGVSKPQNLFDIISRSLESTIKEKNLSANGLVNAMATESAIMMIKNITVNDPEQGGDVSLDSFCRFRAIRVGGPAMAGSELQSDPVGMIIRSFAYKDYLLDASVLYFQPTGTWISINEARKIRAYRETTRELESLYSTMKRSYAEKNVILFGTSLSSFFSVLGQTNSVLVPPQQEPAAPMTTNENEDIPSLPAPSTDSQVNPGGSATEATVQTAEVSLSDSGSSPPQPESSNVTGGDASGYGTQVNETMPRDSLLTTNRIKEVMGNYLKIGIGRKSGNKLGLKCKIYYSGSEIPEHIASGYVAMISDDDCSVEIMSFVGRRTCKQGDIAIFDLSK
jgi:hypothetical protein